MLKANGCYVNLDGNERFTFASDISAVANATNLDFSGLGVGGPSCLFLCWTKQTQKVDERKWGETARKDQGSHAECSSRVPAGAIPASIGGLINLQELRLQENRLSGTAFLSCVVPVQHNCSDM